MRAYSRATELGLLIWPCVIAAVGLAQLQIVRATPWSTRETALALTIPMLAILSHVWLSFGRPRADRVLLPVALTLAALGLITVERLRPDLGLRQAVWLALGLGGLFLGGWLAGHRAWLLRYRYIAGALGLTLTAATLIFGVDPNGSGARLWFSIRGVSMQPVELMKILLVVWLAGYLHEHGDIIRYASSRIGPVRLPPLPYLIPLGIVFLLTELLLVIQRDLGAGLLISLVFISMIYMASGRLSLLGLGVVILVLAAFVAATSIDHVALRVSTWIDPWAQADGGGYQTIQGLIALANGGLLGTGLGLGSPTFVPAVHTDFSIVAIVEELGLAGGVSVLALYVLLIHRGFRITLSLDDGYSQLLAAGLTTVLGVQTLLILGGVLKLLPLTGITLPWISYGGSSILANALIAGMLLGLVPESDRPDA
jgi:cell division protein FtsW (lipid II flippase)